MASTDVEIPSHETMKKVSEEGLEARNLVNWIADGSLDVKTSKKPPTSPRPQSVSPKPLSGDSAKGTETKLLNRTGKRRAALSRPKSRLRSASAGRNPEKDLRARYWTFLFENLHRAVDEIYQTCEMDESIVESKEAIMMLENYSKDFHALIQYININKNYEKTAPPDRPTSLAWEIRKSSPGKSFLKNVFIEKLTAGSSSHAKRILCFDMPNESRSLGETEISKDSNHKQVSDNQCHTTLNGVIACKANSVINTNCQNKPTVSKENDVAISFTAESADVFPCNQNLIVNEVRCLSNDLIEKPNIIIENEGENLNEDTERSTLKMNGNIHAEKLKTTQNIESTSNKETLQANNIVQNLESQNSIKLMVNGDAHAEEIETIQNVECIGNKKAVLANNMLQNVDLQNSVESASLVHSKCDISDSANEIGCKDVVLEDKISISVTKNLSSKSVCNSKEDEKKKLCSKAKTLKKNFNDKVLVPHNSCKPGHLFEDKVTIKSDNKPSEPSVTMTGENTEKPLLKSSDTTVLKKDNSCIVSKTMSSVNVLKNVTSKPKANTNKAAISNSSPSIEKPLVSHSVAKTSCPEKPSFTHSVAKTPCAEKPQVSHSVAKTHCPEKPSFSHSVAKTSCPERPLVSNSVTKTPCPRPSSALRKSSGKVTNSSDEKKVPRANNESAIKRNISYVSSLSSKNHLEKLLNNNVKKTPTRTVSHAVKLPQKSGSMSSLNKIAATRTWSDKASSVEQIPEIIKYNADEDSDGWETVRSRNRCRNSPAKKIPFLNEKKENQAVQMAKLNQSRIGGFPYTNKTSPRGITKNSQKSAGSSKESNKGEKNEKKGKVLKAVSVSSTDNSEASNKIHSASPTLLISSVNSDNANKASKCPSESQGDILAINNNKKIENRKLESMNKETITENPNLSYEFKNIVGNHSRKESLTLPLAKAKMCDKNQDCFNMFKPNHITRSTSAPSLYIENCKDSYSFSKNMCLSDQSLGNQNYVNVKLLKRKFSEKGINTTKRRNRKSSTKSLNNSSGESNVLNTSLDESDTGLTSDDQDGQMSHDEAFDAQCQDLCDTAWKYKILEQQVHKLELSWGEQMDRFDMELRTPGRALEMHEKLSSPFRKKSLLESIRVCNEKQLKAQEQRERLLVEKAQKFKVIQKKRQEMKALVEQRQEKQRVLMEQKLQRAEEKRRKQLEMIIRKAHDEEEKVNEIAFINTLEAQNKKHDLISKEKDHEARLHDIQEERQRKQEEKAAKEAAAEERRKLLEAERLTRLNEMQEKRKMRDHKVEQLFLVKEKERQELASQKARDRELRLSALNAQQQIIIEELQKKIQLKQEESARRHEENMEQIRQKAFELSVRRCSSNNDDVPQPVPYETKKICTMCNVLIGSEVYLLSHLRGKKHQETVKDQYQGQDPSVEELELYNLKHIVDASTDQLDPNIALDKERQKALKKRCKKLRQRMSNRGQEYISQLEKTADTANSNIKSKMAKIINDVTKLISSEKTPADANAFSSLERCLNEIDNILEKKLFQDKVTFRIVGGISALVDIFKLVSSLPMEKNAFIHKKIINHVSATSESVVENCYENSMFILYSNKIGILLDLLIRRLNSLIPDNCSQIAVNTAKSGEINVQTDAVAGKLMHFLSTILMALSAKNKLSSSHYDLDKVNQKENKPDEFQFRVQDLISYIVSIGIVDKISQYFHGVQGPISNESEVANFLLDCISFLTALIKLYSDCFSSSPNAKTDDTTQLIATFKVTNMIGAVSLLYGLLLHSGAPSRGENPPPKLPNQIEVLACSTLRMLNHVAVMNLQAFQSILGSEGISLQLRHITSHLLWYCSHWTSDTLLHEIIVLVGYFTVLNADNQALIQAGQRPTVLQQLCSLPFLYFSDSELTDILFPTLIACCFNNSSNKTILEQEMTSELLSNYIEVKYMNTDNSNSIKHKNGLSDKYWLFSTRFPKNYWTSAKQYFSVK